jgi:fumarylacetoacetate (FAA) hydrolase
MKLATLHDGSRDGALIIVRRDNAVFVRADDIAPSLQAALDDWDTVSPKLEARFAALQDGAIDGEALDVAALHSPLPRAYEWIDGSAYVNHVVLVRKARNAEPPATLLTDPLVYQGGSGVFLRPTEDIVQHDAGLGLDFEAELVAILGDTPRGTTSADAAKHIKLYTMVNDITLRSLIPAELKKNFGFFVSKPASAFGPIAVTPDELGPHLDNGRIHLRVEVKYNDEVVGRAHAGPEMHFSFHDLVQHVTQTRAFTAGTLLGSGTVSNEDWDVGFSCLAEQRMKEIIRDGGAKTTFMKPGDTVRIEVRTEEGDSIFGAISQRVVAG